MILHRTAAYIHRTAQLIYSSEWKGSFLCQNTSTAINHWILNGEYVSHHHQMEDGKENVQIGSSRQGSQVFYRQTCNLQKMARFKAYQMTYFTANR